MMERKQYVVIGEAPESDSEEEVNVSVGVSVLQNKQHSNNSNPQGIIVAGEAPESDEECEEEEIGSVSSVSSAASVSSIASLTSGIKKSKISEKSKKQDAVKHISLLHKKLRERNISLHKNVSEFIHHTIVSAARDLNTTNQQLLRSQVELQEAATSLHILQTHLKHLHTKLAAVTSVSYLPKINISHA